MTKRPLRCLVAIGTLLLVTSPAHATMITTDFGSFATVEAINLSYSQGFTLKGDLGIDMDGAPSVAPYHLVVSDNAPLNVYHNGTFVPPVLFDTIIPGFLQTLNYNLAIAIPHGDNGAIFPVTPFDVKLNGLTAIGGTVSCIANCGVSAVPLPDGLTMFGAAILAFAGFAAWNSRRTARG